MVERNTLCVTKQAALHTAAMVTRPQGMSVTTWRGVQALLEAIALSYPKAYPSQVRLAARLDVSPSTVKRYVAAAVKAGLLVVTPDQGAVPRKHHGSKTNRYHLVAGQSYGVKLTPQEILYSYGVEAGTSSQETSSPGTKSARPSASPILEGTHSSRNQGSTVVVMRDWQQEHDRQVGLPPSDSPQAPVRSPKPLSRPPASEIARRFDSGTRRRKRPPAPPPQWKRLAQYFAVLWEQMQQDTGRHKDTRGLESYNQARTYIEAHFGSRSELEVRKMMEEFVTAVSKRDINIKPGQSAWMCFTGAWGRQRHVETGDRYAAYRKKG